MFGNSNLTKDASFENTLFASFPSNLIGIRPSHRKICPHGDYTRYTNLTQAPSAATDAADTTIGYTSLGQLSTIVHSHNGTTIEELAYGYDTLSRVNAISSTIDGETALGYDVNSQLVSAMYSGAGAPPTETESYDKNGNRTNPGYTIGADNLITSDGTFNYTHDGEGNVTRRTRISTAYASDYEVDYSWDFRNRLTDTLFYDNNHVLTKQVHDVYDVFDQLIEQDVDPTGSGTYTQIVHHVWDGEGIVLDFNGQNQLTERYLNGPNTSATDSVFSTLAEEQVSSLTSPGTVTFNLLDNLGSVRDVVDANGVLQDHIDYTAFGQVAHETNSAVHHLTGFAGGLPDPNTGLVLFGHRWYDAANAVWMSSDPLGFGGGDANLQRYVGNDPADEVDRTGEFKSKVHRELTKSAAKKSGVPIHNVDLIAEENVDTDTHNLTDPSYHAQDPTFVRTMKRLMNEIKTNKCEDEIAVDELYISIGQALHILQDFYSHSDWIDGKKLVPLYQLYKDDKDYDDLGEERLIERGKGNPPHKNTLDLRKLDKGDSSEVDDVVLFGGGYWPTGKGSQHNRYAADNPGFGRDAKAPKGIPGCHNSARKLAEKQTIEFFKWLDKNVTIKEARETLFD